MTVRSILRKLRTQWLGLPAGRPRRRPSRSVVLGFESLETRVVPAVDTWTGVGTPDMTHGGALDWSDTANWSQGIPNPGDDLVFPAGVSASLTSTFNDFAPGTTFNSITIQGSNYTLAGNQVNLMATAGNPGGGGYVFASTLALNNVISLDLELGGVAGQRQSMTVNAGADLTLSGHLLGPGGVELDKQGTGTLVFSNNDSAFTGPVMVDQGILRIEDPSALGSGGAATTVQTGAQLQMSNANGGVSQALVLNGTGISNDGALLALAGNASWGGAVILGTDSTIGVAGGVTTGIAAASESGTTVTVTTASAHGLQVGENVTIAGVTPLGYDGTFVVTGVSDPTHFTYTAAAGLGAATTAGATATPVGATLNITGQLSDLGAGHNLTKEGLGELILSSANTYRGQTIINNGFLTIQNPFALGTAGSDQNGTIVNSSATEKGTLQVKDPTGLGFNVVGEHLTLNGPGATVNGVAVGALNGLDGNNTWAGPITLTGNTSIGAVAKSDVLFNIAGSISDSVTGANFRLTKVGLGDLEFSGANTYGGPTDIQQGRLLAANPLALGGTANGTTVEAGAELALQADVGTKAAVNNEPLFLNGDGVAGAGALDSLTSNNNYFGPVTLQSDSTIGAEANSQLIIQNTIGDAGNGFNLTKAGPGILTLAHSTTYGGTTLVNAGTLQLSDPMGLALQNSIGTQVASGASLELVGNITVTGEPLTLTGPGVGGASGALQGAGGSSTWAGLITLDGLAALGAGAGATLTVTGVMSDGTSPGIVAKVGAGTVVLDAPNTYTGNTTVMDGTLTLEDPGAVGGSSATSVSDGATLLLANGVTITGEPLTLTGAGVLNGGALTDSSDATWAGPVTLVASATNPSATVGAAAGTDLTISGPIGGAAGSLDMVGPGTVTLSAVNTYGGGTTIGAGTLVVDGTIGDVAVQSGELTGSGQVGAITTAPSATVEPGDSNGFTLTSVGNGSLIAASTFKPQINGTTQGTDYSFLKVTGTFNLNQATLDAVLGSGFVPDIGGATFTIIQSSGALSGTFANAPINPVTGIATVVVQGLNFQVFYNPNDVTLQRVKADTTTTIVLPTTADQLAKQSTLTATVVAANGATGSPTGNVDFMDVTDPANPIDLGSAPLQLVNGVPTATLSSTVQALHAGIHQIVAMYDGSDPDFNPSTSAPVTVGGLAVIGLAPSRPVAQLSSVTFTFNTGVPVGNFPLSAVSLTGPSGQAILRTGIAAASESGTTVTITTASAHGFLVGESVVIAGVTPSGYDGTFVITSVPDSTHFTYTAAAGLGAVITGASETGTTVTITTASAHGFQMGESVTITGITPLGYDGTFVITGVPNATHFTYTAAAGLGLATVGSSATATATAGSSATATAAGVSLDDTNPGADTVWELNFPTQMAAGVYTVTVGAGPNNPAGQDVTDSTGTKMDQNQDHSPGEFGPAPQGDEFVGFLTVGGLNVVSVTPTTVVDDNGLSSMLLTFNAAVSSFPTSAVALTGPTGITAASEAGTTVTITTASPHGYQVGASVTIAGITPSGYDGTFVVTGVPDATHFTYTAASGLGAATVSSGATATGPIPLTASQNPSVSLITLTDKNPGIDTLWQLTVPTQTTPGAYTLTIGPNVLDRAGNPMPAAFQQLLTVQPLTVLTVQPAGLPTSLSSITLTFNEAAQLGLALGAGNVSVLDPSGNPIQGLTVSDLTLGTPNPGHDVWQVNLPNPASAPGTYTLELGAGVLDGAGRQLGTPFTAKFQVASVTTSSSQPPPTTTGTPLLNGQIISSGITFLPGPITAIRGAKPGNFAESLTFFNFGTQQLQGQFSLVLAGLPTAGRKGHRGVKVLNRAGTSHSVVPGSPYVLTFLSNAQALSFQGATVVLHFRASRKSDITFTPILVVGTP